MPSRYEVKSGKLVRFGGGTTEVLAPWPRPRGWRKGPDDRTWSHVRPAIRLPAWDIERLISRQLKRMQAPMPPHDMLLEKFKREDRLNFLYWAGHIPKEVRRSIAPFRDRNWHLLSMLARCGSSALDLLNTNPALAYALASSWVFRQSPVSQPMRSIRALLRRGRKQREILAWLDFPDSEAVRRILSRVVPASCTIPGLLYLRDSCADPQVRKTLSHLDRINQPVLRIVTDPALRERVGFNVLQRLSNKKSQDKTARLAWMLRDLDRMCHALEIRPRRIWQLEHIEQIHDEMMENLPEGYDPEKLVPQNTPFPDPPMSGNQFIEPITNAAMLHEEGVLQKHCVWSYGHEVAVTKSVYIYRVMAPERATLSLVRAGEGWKIGQLKGIRNREVSPETRKTVMQWFVAAERGGNQCDSSMNAGKESGSVFQRDLFPGESRSTGE